MEKIKDNIKGSKGKSTSYTQGNYRKAVTADFSAETLKARRHLHNVFKVMKGKNLQQRIHYQARLSFRFDGQSKNFVDKQKFRNQHHQTNIKKQKMLNGPPLGEKEKATTRNVKIREGKSSGKGQ